MEMIRERDSGDVHGKPIATFGQEAQKAKKEYREYRPNNGESLEDVNKRCFKFLEFLVREHLMRK